MNSEYLQRVEDGKTFEVECSGHWIGIINRNADDTFEVDEVKFYGVDNGVELYVSRNKGFSYKAL